MTFSYEKRNLMGVAENIDALLVKHDITQETLARVAGISQAAVSGWRHGKKPSNSSLKKICDYFDLEPNDILSDKYGLAAKEHGLARNIAKGAKSVTGMEMGYVPLRGRVHAGPFTAPENLEARAEMVLIPQFLIDSDPDTYALESEGDCMNKVYPEGCIIIVSPNREPQNGSVAVVALDCNDSIMRRMVRTSSTLILSPESWNPEHKDIIITEDSDHSVEFWGKVVWFQPSKEME